MKINLWIGLVTSIAITASCKQATQQQTENKKEYPVVSISQKDTIVNSEYVADIQAKKNVEIHSRSVGILEKIFVDEGQRVRKGQPLFKISDAQLHIELDRATARYNSTIAESKVFEVEVKQIQTLYDKNVVAINELDLAKAKLQAAQAKVAEALAEKSAIQKRISLTHIVAPFDGVIDRIPLKEGSMVTEGSLLTTLSDLGEIFAYFKIPESEYIQMIQSNESDNVHDIKLQLADGSVYPVEGKIETAESEIDRNTGTIAYRARFTNANGIIKHGASGKLIIAQKEHNVMLIPQKSVVEIQDKNYVFVVNDQHQVTMKNVIPFKRIGDNYIVQDGLQANDKIVIEGVRNLKDGDTIAPKFL